MLAAFYNTDVIEDDDIKAWILDPNSKFAADTPGNVCWRQGVVLFKAIQAQDEDEDEESD